MFIKEITEESIGLPVTQGIDWATVPTRVGVSWIIENATGEIAMFETATSHNEEDSNAWPLCELPSGSVNGESLETALQISVLEDVWNIIDIKPLGIVREMRTQPELCIYCTIVFSAKVSWNSRDIPGLLWIPKADVVSKFSNLLLAENFSYGEQFAIHREFAIIQEYMTIWSVNPQIKELEDIAKNAQYNYIMLKSEFDSLVRRTENDSKEGKVNQLVELAKKLTPIIDQLGQTVSHIPAELADNTWASGVKLVYENAIKTLATVGISLIATIGEEPDMELHEPLSVEPTDDDTLKGKITKEFQPGYVYEKDGIRKVITAAKVIVGQ